MRKRDIQSFTLRLSDLKEYEQAKAEREAAKKNDEPNAKKNLDELIPHHMSKFGPRRKQEIRERIGLPME